MNFFALHGARRNLNKTIRHARNIFLMREDLLTPEEHARFTAAFENANAALRGRDLEAAIEAENALAELADACTPRTSFTELRSIFEVWVTALAVAMAFRAYFYQPFRIPTNSMYPTLYGITSVDDPRDWADKSIALQIPKWLLTGSWYKEVRATSAGVLSYIQSNKKPGYSALSAGGVVYYVPSDLIAQGFGTDAVVVRGRHMATPPGSHVIPGQLIWEGRVTLGDFVFVNRWKWNLMRPRRGEVMVFSTEGLKGDAQGRNYLDPGQHYIKRMCGLPNETLEIHTPELVINGQPANDHPMIRLIASQGTLGAWAPCNYIGFTIAHFSYESRDPDFAAKQLTRPESKVHLDANSYYALGDNSSGSYDSRYWGPVPAKNLLGPGAVVYWPFINPRWGRIP